MVISGYLGQVLAKFSIEPVEIIFSVHAIHTTSTSASAVKPKGCYTSDDVGIPDAYRCVDRQTAEVFSNRQVLL